MFFTFHPHSFEMLLFIFLLLLINLFLDTLLNYLILLDEKLLILTHDQLLDILIIVIDFFF